MQPVLSLIWRQKVGCNAPWASASPARNATTVATPAVPEDNVGPATSIAWGGKPFPFACEQYTVETEIRKHQNNNDTADPEKTSRQPSPKLDEK